MQIEYAIIGTGPSAIAAAAALIESGIKPTFIDAGSLENGKVLVAKTLKTRGSTAAIPKQPNSPGQKAWFGSFDPYLQKFETNAQFDKDLNVRPSNAIGGFSRIWGATFDFWPDDNRWPAGAKINEVDYEKIKSLMPQGTVSFEPPENNTSQLPAATSSSKIYHRLRSRTPRVKFEITPAKLAVETFGENGCTHCLSCLDGCPQDSIWFSGSQIQKWINCEQANLIEGFFVKTIHSKAQENVIQGIDTETNVKTLFARKIYLAAGALGTASIVLNSTDLTQIEIKDTSTIFTAGLSLFKQPKNERGHSLSQFWLRWSGRQKIVAQVYAPNTTNIKRLISRFQFLSKFIDLLTPVVLRLHPIIIYLDELKSPSILMKKCAQGIKVYEATNFEYKKFRSAAVAKVRSTFLSAGLLVPPIGTDFSRAGTGYHFGASLPMGLLTDDLGRIGSWENVHIVDSSVLPYLENGSITPTVMANAHRIARLSVQS